MRLGCVEASCWRWLRSGSSSRRHQVGLGRLRIKLIALHSKACSTKTLHVNCTLPTEARTAELEVVPVFLCSFQAVLRCF